MNYNLVLWKPLHINALTGKKIKKNQFQCKMASFHYLALFWRNTKIVNYFTNFHSPEELAIKMKRKSGKIEKIPQLIPSNSIYFLFYL